ncbi:MAG: hypothetical protein IT440_15895, partial [Phycisphaeraceae bacterium]|nr:hypothetical protein [Phycisphaeraceae bacterium]
LGWLGFAAQGHIEGRSALCGKIGQKVFSDKFSLKADPFDPRFEGMPFDMEGFARKPVTLIENGVVKGLTHDRRSAKLLGGENNGYAMEQPCSSGPEVDCLAVKEGNSTVEKMIESTERGLLVTQFHYTTAVDPMKLSLTGMTRAGLWLIEKGKIKQPVTNLRFTESLINAFSNIEAIGNIADPCGGGLFGGGMILPAMKIKDFTFSSSTEF